ncbi:MAG: phosphopyruvate hydratase [candidate division WOR-3 bacterium]|nr:phosphopyruvate hydratase [candidate division WOR-3 bacterium]MCX7947234.1 phosphopyruvate hydratase [candidate division WOR-3 bacterium]MDW8150289.1 phosphopyruvate hydratase [candidate division WOR-3 bacterium]
MPQIKRVKAYEVLDSRGNPTVYTTVELEDGSIGSAIVPSGASKGKYEALELRDDEKRFFGKGVKKAVENINNIISKAIVGLEASNQRYIDKFLIDLDGTENKSRLGANAILSVSLAVARAMANYYKMPLFRYIGGVRSYILPVPLMNFINGGVHADNNLDIQEFMIAPIGAKTFREAIEIGVEIFYTLKSILKEKGHITNVGDEGGFAPNLRETKEALDILMMSIEKAGYLNKAKIALDVAGNELFFEGKYRIDGKLLSKEEIISFYKDLVKNYPIFSIEDPCSEDDIECWKDITKELGSKIQIVGDDLFTTNVKRIKMGIENNIANAVLIKLNQIGTLSETIDAVEFSQRNNYKAIVSHRSGETEDNFIADLSIALNTGQIKTGSVSRSDRNSKYNRILIIEEDYGGIYGGLLWNSLSTN